MKLIYSFNPSDYAIDKLYPIFSTRKQNTLSKLRYEYKLEADSESVATGKLLAWLRGQLDSWVGLVPDEAIPKNIAWNTLPLSWWEDTFNHLATIISTLE